METIEAKVVEREGKYFIEIDGGDGVIEIPVSEDKPNEIKSAFNKLIVMIKEREFTIQLIEPGEDLFSEVAKEYLVHLNREIQDVRGEMINLGLVEEVKDDDIF